MLVHRHDYHTFQPLLYQLATGLLETTAVGHSLRDLVERQDNTTVHQATVTGVDLDAREVRFDELAPITYDFLVLGLGAEVNFFGTDGAAEHAFPMYTLPHALRLKDHLLERWEAADRDPGLVDDGVLNVVIVGGGPTGVETAGAIAELYRAVFARDYPALPQEQARVILVEAGPELFSMFKPRLRKYAAKALAERTVEVMTGARVSSVSPTRVTLKSGEELKAHTLVWGAGLQGNRLVQSLGLELQRGNRIAVGADLALPDHPEVYVLGDVAAIPDPKTGQVLPQLGSVALQSGEHAGEVIARRIAGKATKPFRYRAAWDARRCCRGRSDSGGADDGDGRGRRGRPARFCQIGYGIAAFGVGPLEEHRVDPPGLRPGHGRRDGRWRCCRSPSPDGGPSPLPPRPGPRHGA